jgi:ATP-dependent DNA ligase
MMPFGLNKVVALGQDSDMQLCYKVFDMLWVKTENEDINLMSFPLKERKKLLEKVINEVEGKLEIVKYTVLSKYEQIEK